MGNRLDDNRLDAVIAELASIKVFFAHYPAIAVGASERVEALSCAIAALKQLRDLGDGQR